MFQDDEGGTHRFKLSPNDLVCWQPGPDPKELGSIQFQHLPFRVDPRWSNHQKDCIRNTALEYDEETMRLWRDDDGARHCAHYQMINALMDAMAFTRGNLWLIDYDLEYTLGGTPPPGDDEDRRRDFRAKGCRFVEVHEWECPLGYWKYRRGTSFGRQRAMGFVSELVSLFEDAARFHGHEAHAEVGVLACIPRDF